jgi:hypothetical protein
MRFPRQMKTPWENKKNMEKNISKSRRLVKVPEVLRALVSLCDPKKICEMKSMMQTSIEPSSTNRSSGHCLFHIYIYIQRFSDLNK